MMVPMGQNLAHLTEGMTFVHNGIEFVEISNIFLTQGDFLAFADNITHGLYSGDASSVNE